jgi:hypothetical protein
MVFLPKNFVFSEMLLGLFGYGEFDEKRDPFSRPVVDSHFPIVAGDDFMD